MLETATTSYESTDIPSALMTAAELAFELHPDIVGLKDPEILDNMDRLKSEFSVRDSFFEGEKAIANTLLLASLSSNLSQLESKGATPLSNPAGFEYIADTMVVIAMDHIDGFEEVVNKAQQEVAGDLSETSFEAVLNKYKSVELTVALDEKIRTTELLKSVREKLGITEANEDPYELLVLSVASDTSMVEFDTDSEYPDYDTLPRSHQLSDEDKAKYKLQGDVASADTDAKREWQKGLIQRRNAFMRDTGNDYVAPAFVTSIKGKTYLCLAADTAELLAYEQPELRSEYYDEAERGRTLAYLHHEYTHTQGITSLDNLVGIGIEERRAELFSGDKHGYQDIKIFFQDIRLITGFDITDTLKSRVKGGKNHEIYGDIAAELGLDMLVKIVTAFPRNYVREQSSEVLRNMDEYMAGYDGITQELYKKIADDPDSIAAMGARIDQSIKRINPDFVGFIVNMRKQNGSNFGTSLIEERLESI